MPSGTNKEFLVQFDRLRIQDVFQKLKTNSAAFQNKCNLLARPIRLDLLFESFR